MVYRPRDRLKDCDVCGYTYHISQLKKGVSGTQIGFAVCQKCFDPVHPRDNKVVLRKVHKMREVN